MPEGHTIRHLATTLSYGFVGTFVQASSPQKRFSNDAEKINDRIMTETSAHGKHLFLHFDTDIVHIHLGLYGWFKLRKQKGQKAGDSVRLRLANDEYLADLTGPTKCELISYEDMLRQKEKLGPDPIHDDADPERAWTKISKSKKTIGGLLMDQSVIAGIGNVYRAEILFLNRVSPFIHGRDVSREKFDAIWNDSVRLLKIGAEDGRIKTLLPEHVQEFGVDLHGDTQYSYVYKRTGNSCLVCGSSVLTDVIDNRNVYWCPECQHE